jgi:hypothetical protein
MLVGRIIDDRMLKGFGRKQSWLNEGTIVVFAWKD